MSALVLAVRTTAQATGMALFCGGRLVRAQEAAHADAELSGKRFDPRGVRVGAVRAFLAASGVVRGGLAAVVAHGGRLRPVEGGTYAISDALVRDAQGGVHAHAANGAALLAHAVGAEWGCPAFVVDPESVDERETLARLSDGAQRECCCALAMRAAARRHALAVDRPLETLRLVAGRLAERVTLSAFRCGRMVDVVEPWPDRAASHAQPAEALSPASAAFSPVPITGVEELFAALARAERGDSRSIITLEAAAYRIAKAIGELAAALEGDVDAVLLTGLLAGAGPVVAEVCRRVEWIAPVFLYPDEDELRALADGALRVLSGEERPKLYA